MSAQKRPARATRASVVLALVGVLLTGCGEGEPAMSPEQAQAASMAMTKKVVAFLGGPEGWTPLVRNVPRPCTDGLPYDHVYYTNGQQIEPGIADLGERRALGEKVREYLESLGLKTSYLGENDPDLTTVVGRGPSIDTIDIHIRKEFVSVNTGSLCVPGDVHKLIEEYVATSPPEPPRYRVVTDPPTPPPTPTP